MHRNKPSTQAALPGHKSPVRINTTNGAVPKNTSHARQNGRWKVMTILMTPAVRTEAAKRTVSIDMANTDSGPRMSATVR